MSTRKTIIFLLLDGSLDGVIKCTGYGVAYKIPRTQLETCKDKTTDMAKHLKQAGIYFLLGENSDGHPTIYVGQAAQRKNGEATLQRLLEHKNNEKEPYWADWNEAIVFTTLKTPFGPTELNYLENKFSTLANSAHRYEVQNANDPSTAYIPEEKEPEMEDFIDFVKITMFLLGHKAFEPITGQRPRVEQTKQIKQVDEPRQEATAKADETIVFNFKGENKASAIITNEGFVVLKGSCIIKDTKISCPDSIKKLRKQYESKIDENRILLVDVPCTSSSAAAEFVAGTSRSGNVCWRTEDNKSPKDYGM